MTENLSASLPDKSEEISTDMSNDLVLDVSAIEDIPVLETADIAALEADAINSADIPVLQADEIPILGEAITPVEEQKTLKSSIGKLDNEVEEMILDLGYDGDNSNEASDQDNPHCELPIEQKNNEIRLSDGDALAYSGDDLFIDHEERRIKTQKAQTNPALESQTEIRQKYTPDQEASFVAEVSNEEQEGDDNPFLPKHLRERLDKSKQNLLEEIARSGEALNASSTILKCYTEPVVDAELDAAVAAQEKTPVAAEEPAPTFGLGSSHQEIIDALVAQYLPIIETELRTKLMKSLSTTFQLQDAKLKENHDHETFHSKKS